MSLIPEAARKRFELVYTKGGYGTAIVIDGEMRCFYRVSDNIVYACAGEPMMSIDGGCHAEAPVYLSDRILREWVDEGWTMGRTPDGFRDLILAIFREA